MTNLNEKNCAYCGNIFSLVYTDKHGYNSILNTAHCSKSCATSASRSISKNLLEEKALNFIRTKNEYCTGQEIRNGIGYSSKTFVKHNVSIVSLNEQLGHIKPKSKFENSVKDILSENFTGVECQKTFDGLAGSTGYPLKVDFFIPELNTVVEADDNQHKDPNHPWHEWNNGTVKGYDQIKDDFFKERNITVVRIPYKRNLKDSDILSRLS